MSTIKEPKTKTAKRFRVKIGESYARLNQDLHKDGALMPCAHVSSATVFKTNASAGAAIQRTMKLQNATAIGVQPPDLG